MTTPQRHRVAERANGQVNQLERTAPLSLTASGGVTLRTTSKPTYVQVYATADRTLGAYTSNSQAVAYVGIATGVAGTPYAQVVDLEALRTAYQNLRAFAEDLAQQHNALIDDLQSFGAFG